MGEWLEDFNQWLEDMAATHKVLFGVAIFFVSRWAYDSFRENQIHLPLSDDDRSSQIIQLRTQGNAGVYTTLDAMAQIIKRDAGSQYLRHIALYLVRGCPGHDGSCEVARLFEFARDQITYRRDPTGVERVADGRRTIQAGAGDCDDKVTLLCSLLACIGFTTRLVVCGFKRNSYSHVYCQVNLSGRWIALDPTPEKSVMGWEQTQAPYREVFKIF